MRPVRSFIWSWVFCLCAPLGAQPVIERMEPHGGEVGKAVRVKLVGNRLGPAPRLISEAPFVATPLARADAQGQMLPGELEFLLEVAGDAAPGVYPLRIETSEGLSNAVLFTVGTFPQVFELEAYPDAEGEIPSNDFPETAQRISAPVTVEGRLQGAERDVYRLTAARGERLVAEVSARRAGSAIDPNLELLDSKGIVVARSADAPGLGLDARLAYEVPADGEYFLAMRDERFSKQDHDFYRLTVGDFEFAESVFPLGWSRGSTVRAEFFGGNLRGPVVAEVDLRDIPGHSRETRIGVPGTPSFVTFLLSDGEEALESEGSRTLRDGVVMNGRLAAAGEVDRYSLAVQSGEQWAFELRSGELPGSSLYGVMTISGGGERLAVAGKHAGDPNPYVTTSTGETATYPFVNLTVPPGVSKITVAVEDLLERGGPAYGYRLLARKQGPDFLLSLVEPFLNIPRAGSVGLQVTAERRGYNGPIQLYVANAPDDIEVYGGHIAPRSTLGNTLPRFTTGRITLSALPGAEMRVHNLVVRGKATAEGREHLDRRATGPGMRVSVKGAKQPAVTAEWLGYDLPARVNPSQPAQVEFLTPRRLRLVRGGDGLVTEWAYTARQPGVRVKQKVAIPRNTGSLRLRSLSGEEAVESGSFRMFTHERTSLGMVNFNISATVSWQGRETTVVSKPLEVDVVDGYGLEAPSSTLELSPGGEVEWSGRIWRDPEFRRMVRISAIGLPAGTECEQAELVSDATKYVLACSAEPNAKSGDYEVEIRAESVLSDEGTTPYSVDPVKVELRVAR